MTINDLESYLQNSKNFWNVPEVEIAMYRRILTNFSVEYKDLCFEEEYQKWQQSTLTDIKKICNGINYSKDWKVLEIGCGIGRLIKPLRDIFEQVDGVDFAEQMVEFSKEYLKDTENKGKIYLNDGKTLNMLDNNFYNFVYSLITIQHIRSHTIVKSYLNETYRILKKGGIFRFQVLQPVENYGKFKDEPDAVTNYSTFGNTYTPEQLYNLLTECKFSNINLETSTDNKALWATCYK